MYKLERGRTAFRPLFVCIFLNLSISVSWKLLKAVIVWESLKEDQSAELRLIILLKIISNIRSLADR